MRLSHVNDIFKIVDELKVEESVGEDDVGCDNNEREDVNYEIISSIDFVTDLRNVPLKTLK